jgi:hypothetical protein
MPRHLPVRFVLSLSLLAACSGCAVVSVGAAVVSVGATVVSTGVSVTGKVVGAAVDAVSSDKTDD